MKHHLIASLFFLALLLPLTGQADQTDGLMKKSDKPACQQFLRKMRHAIDLDGPTATSVANLIIAYRDDTEDERAQLKEERKELFTAVFGEKDVADPGTVSSQHDDVAALEGDILQSLEQLMVDIQGVTTNEQYQKIVRARIDAHRCLLTEDVIFNRVINAWLEKHGGQ